MAISAYVVQSQLAGEKGTASVLEEVGLAYAHGESTRRLPRYLLLARKLKRLDLTLMATVGAVLEVMRIALAAAVGPVLVFVALHLLHSARVGSGQFPPFVILHDHGAWILEHGDGIRLGAVMLAVALATFVARLDMQHATLWLSAAGIAFVCAPALLVFLWAWAPMVKLSSLVFGVFGLVGFGYAMRYVIPLLSLAIWGVCALAFAAIIRLSAGSSDMAGRMLAAAWRESEQEELVGEAVALAGCAVVLAVLWIPLSAALRVLTLWFTYFSNLIGMEAGILAGFILITPVWLICVFVLPFFLPLLRGQGFNFDREFRSSVQLWPLAAIPAVLFVWVLIFAKLPEYLIPLLTSLDRFSSLLIYPVYALVLTLLLIVVGSLAYVTYSVLSPILRRLTRLVVQPQRTTISEWLAEVAASAPAEQARLLRDANPARFNIGLEQTIEAVASLQPVIREEPARSVYDAKMSELVAIRRQRRAG